MTSLPERDQVMALVAEAIVAGARQERACNVISLSEPENFKLVVA
jgi:hypothetical protein